MEEVQAVTNPSSPSISQPLPSTTIWPQAPNLAGAIEFNDVKALLKEWITTISGKLWVYYFLIKVSMSCK